MTSKRHIGDFIPATRRGIRVRDVPVHDAVVRNGGTLSVLAAICLLAGSLQATRVNLPPVPDLPAVGWPIPEDAEPFARALIARIPPEQLDAIGSTNHDLLPGILRNLGTALLSGDPLLQSAVKTYVTALVRAHARRMPRNFSDHDLHALVTLQVIDPLRYGEDEQFRRTVDTILPRSLEPSLPEALRRAALNEINRVAPIGFDSAEALGVAAGLITRRSLDRYVKFESGQPRIVTNGTERIDASIFSLNSRFATASEARRFLTAVRASAPRRRILVIGDPDMRRALTPDLLRLSIDFIDNLSRPVTLWPRDPFFVARAPDGQVVFVNRPNLQFGREEDANMVRIFLNGLPPSLDARWKGARWATGTTSFHNGQLLLTPEAVWISIHSVESRALELIGSVSVPTGDFGSLTGISRYIEAVRRAAAELSAMVGRPARFVHDLPGTQPLAAQAELMATIGGGAGFDLDSVVTLLPIDGGPVEALIGDPSLGAKLAAAAPTGDWSELRRSYALSGDTSSIRDSVVSFQNSTVGMGLQRFLDRCAKDLQNNGVRVQRLPLLMVPSSLLPADEHRPVNPYFLITWNNVVLERGAVSHAEGFASGFPSGDRAARAAFQGAGYRLALFPPLPRSVILNGGYRCASNEVRESQQ